MSPSSSAPPSNTRTSVTRQTERLPSLIPLGISASTVVDSAQAEPSRSSGFGVQGALNPTEKSYVVPAVGEGALLRSVARTLNDVRSSPA